MKKSLIALAVAGAFAAPAAFAASANVDVYGIMNIAIQDTDVSNVDMEVVDNVSRVGMKGSEDLGGGLKAVWQIESAIGDGANGVGTASIGGRNTFVGLAGGFGTFVVGRHDTPYKLGTGSLDIFGDTIADYNTGRLAGVQLLNDTHDHRSPQAIAYISPTWSGFHFAAAIVAADANGIDSGDTADAFSATGVYANGPLFASLSYQSIELLDSDAWKLGASYAFGDTTVGFAYENVDQAVDRDSWLLNVKHAMGPITLKAQYGQVDVGSADQDQLAIGADYALSKRTTAYFVYGAGDNDVTDASGWNLGVKHSF
ncbi:MAG: porin [Hydrogenophilales bacterium]|nr:porin [Hydrogenophilales bacterium]